MSSSGETPELTPDSDGVVDLSQLREAVSDPLEAAESASEPDGASLDEILWQYREAILSLHARVEELERRPQFAASIRGRRTGA
jgi:hypothetical protein